MTWVQIADDDFLNLDNVVRATFGCDERDVLCGRVTTVAPSSMSLYDSDQHRVVPEIYEVRGERALRLLKALRQIAGTG